MKFIKYPFLVLAVIVISLASMASMPYAAPTRPTPQYPTGGVYTQNFIPTLQWAASVPAAGTTIVGYKVELTIDITFTNVIKSYIVPGTELKKTIPNTDALQPGKIYYWRVYSQNNLSQKSPWSAIATFRTPSKPTKPALQSPVLDVLLATYNPVLKWGASAPVPVGVTTIVAYELQTSMISTFPAGNFKTYSLGNVLAMAIPAADTLLPSMKYYWRVRGQNNLGLWSDWSNVGSFRTTIKRPVSLDPKTGAGSVPDFPGSGGPGDVNGNVNLLKLRPTFKWASYAGSQSFALQISKGCDFNVQTLTINVTGGSNQYIPVADLSPSSYYCWKVRANNSTFGPSAWSNVQAFLTPNPPPVTALMDPPDKSLTNDNSPRLDWSTILPAAGTYFGQYEVEISDTANFKDYTYHRIINSSTIPGLGAAEHSYYDIPDENSPFPPDQLPGADTYYWRVRTYNKNPSYGTPLPAWEYSAWSGVRSLLISVDRPTNLTTVPNPPTDLRPLFDWDDVYEAEIYHLTVTAFGYADPLIDINIRNGSRYRPTVDLPPGVYIFWKVQALDANGVYGTSLETDLMQFLSPNSPTTPTLTAPTLNAIITDTTPTFKWNLSTFPGGTVLNHYEIKIADDAAFTLNVVSQNVPVNSYTPAAPMGQGKRYYWKVRTCDSASSCSAWSTISYFTIQ